MRITQRHFVHAGLIALLAVSGFILLIGYLSWSPINQQAAGHIQAGMTLQHVEQILGGPCSFEMRVPAHKAADREMPQRTLRFWRDAHAGCTVLFDSADRVERASFREFPDPGPLARILGLFRVGR